MLAIAMVLAKLQVTETGFQFRDFLSQRAVVPRMAVMRRLNLSKIPL